MTYRKLALLLLLLVFPTGALLAQQEPVLEHPYAVCEWGLLIIEEDSSRLHITGIENTADSITISGTGQGLFENNVVIQALDGDGEVLAEMPTTMSTEEIGGAGEWSTELSVPVEADVFGQLVAFSPSPADGEGVLAQDQAYVTFRPDGSLVYLLITDPPRGAFRPDDSFIRVSGTGQAGVDENVLFLIETETGRDMLNEMTTLANGTWVIDQPISFDLVDTPTIVWYLAALLDGSEEFPAAYDYVPVLAGGALADFPLTLSIATDDMILTAESPCEAAQNQMAGGDAQIPLTVDSVLVQSTFSEPPQANLLVSGSQPATCDFPLRTLVSRDTAAITAEIYHYVPADAGCGGESIPYTASIPLGELTADTTFTVNGVSAE